jgi:hypothetical protein
MESKMRKNLCFAVIKKIITLTDVSNPHGSSSGSN